MAKKILLLGWNYFKKLDRTFVATAVVALFFFVSVAGFFFPSFSEWSAKFANRNYNGEGLIEYVEAICWMLACIVYISLFVNEYRKNKFTFFAFWTIFFAAFCFVCCGEELSWGQHLFKYEVNEFVSEYNKQRETNIHNLNISKIIGIPVDDPKYRLFRNFNSILNPLFYLVCGIFWFVIPFVKKMGFFSKNKFFYYFPTPSLSTAIFCGASLFAYLIIDKLFFDIGEILELSLALVGLMVPLDVSFSVLKLNQVEHFGPSTVTPQQELITAERKKI
ncbi:MAG: hypothetical protein R2864_14015 [Syntrophotaleaceae bacterium]